MCDCLGPRTPEGEVDLAAQSMGSYRRLLSGRVTGLNSIPEDLSPFPVEEGMGWGAAGGPGKGYDCGPEEKAQAWIRE